MDRLLIETKLESLRRCLERIRLKAPEAAETLAHDVDLQDIVALNLQRAVQICVDIATHVIADSDASPPSTMGENFDTLAEMGIIDADLASNLKKAVGFRNIAVHSYREIDWNIVQEISKKSVAYFKRFAQQIMRHIS